MSLQRGLCLPDVTQHLYRVRSGPVFIQFFLNLYVVAVLTHHPVAGLGRQNVAPDGLGSIPYSLQQLERRLEVVHGQTH